MDIKEWNKKQDRLFFGYQNRANREVDRTINQTRAIRQLTIPTILAKTGLDFATVKARMDLHPNLSRLTEKRYDWHPSEKPVNTDEDPLDFSKCI